MTFTESNTIEQMILDAAKQVSVVLNNANKGGKP
jgi:hypothetical protein